MQQRGVELNAYSFNTAISACGKGRQWERALALLEEMQQGGIGAAAGATVADQALAPADAAEDESTSQTGRTGLDRILARWKRYSCGTSCPEAEVYKWKTASNSAAANSASQGAKTEGAVQGGHGA